MEIKKLHVTIEPSYFNANYIRLKVKVETHVTDFNFEQHVKRDDFKDLFGLLMQDAEHEIRRIIQHR